MDDEEALLWDTSRRKRDLDEFDKNEGTDSKKQARDAKTTEHVEVPRTSGEHSTKAEIPVEITKENLKEDVDNEKNFTNEEIHAKLKAVDPKMAARLHPNNRRKILR